MTKITAAVAADLTDELGILKSQKGPLEKREKEIKTDLAFYTNEYGAVDGRLFHANVTNYDQEHVDTKALIAKLESLIGKTRAQTFVKKHTNPSHVVKVTCTALIGARSNI